MADAARVGFGTIVEQAMAESREPIRIVAHCTFAQLTISLFERGLPVDDAFARRDPHWAELAENVDAAHWHAHGASGSELRLIVNRSHAHEPADAPPPSHDVPLAPPQEYTVRRFQPGDGPGVARAFYLTYGYHYDLSAVYTPAHLTKLNEAGHYISIVAIAGDGEVVGHYALIREADEPIADAGGAIVLPAHRGRELLNRLRDEAEREAIRLGLVGYYSEPVTDHPRTQRASESFGAKACGITLGETPRNFLAKHMELSTTAQRQSFMLYVKPLRQRERTIVYVPQRHREIVARIYEQLNLAVEIRDGSAPVQRGSFRTTVVTADGIAQIAVDRVGPESAQLLRQATDDLRKLRHLGAIYLSLPLDDPATPALCDAMEKTGYFLSGVGPWMLEGRDALRLQLPLTPIDLSSLTVVSEFGRTLLDYIAAERDRCAKLTGEAEAVD